MLSAAKRKTSDVHRAGRTRFMRPIGTYGPHEIFGPTRLHVGRAESLCVLRHSSPARFGQMKNEWDVDAAIATYNVDGWGEGYFTVNATGNVVAQPLQQNRGSIDILEIINEARNRGLSFPLVIRFQDLLRHRVETVNRAFQNAITEFGYKNEYRGVFP